MILRLATGLIGTASRPSRRGRRRALSRGKTLTPVEPSEAMTALGQGLVNAGFVLFAILILSTLVFGRFFCGWGCHVVAPLLAACSMFVLLNFVRLWIGAPLSPSKGCAHCTVNCTSNVGVHEEVRLYRMVTDSGCMKRRDCISA